MIYAPTPIWQSNTMEVSFPSPAKKAFLVELGATLTIAALTG
jgi:hypothetical protein